ncbi:SCO2583 family membrane protein, partial [Streptomyces lonarensis]
MTAGRSDPPGGAAGEVPDHGDDEFRATVFDESFVRAASLQEHSAAQRLEPGTFPVHPRDPDPRPDGRSGRLLPRNGLAVAAVLVTAVLIAVFLGNSGLQPAVHRSPDIVPAGSLLPLAPQGAVPAAAPEDPYAGSVADGFGTELVLPEASAVGEWDRDQVIDALVLARRYVTASSLTPDVLVGGAVAPVRALLTPFQQHRLDRALRTGPGPVRASTFLVRFEPGTVGLAEDGTRVEGAFAVEQAQGRLSVSARHRFAYALVPADDPLADPSLFLLHREVVLSFGEEELAAGQVALESTTATAGPLDCADPADAPALRPLLAGQRPAAARHRGAGDGAAEIPGVPPATAGSADSSPVDGSEHGEGGPGGDEHGEGGPTAGAEPTADPDAAAGREPAATSVAGEPADGEAAPGGNGPVGRTGAGPGLDPLGLPAA